MDSMEQKKTNSQLWKKYRGLVLVVLAALLVEIFVFNFRTFQSLFYEEVSVMDKIIAVEGMTYYGDGYFTLDDGENGVIYFGDLQAPMHNMYVKVSVPTSVDLPYMETGVCYVSPYLCDEGNSTMYSPNTEAVLGKVEDSKYIWFESMGNVNSGKIELSLSSGYSVQIDDIVLNAKRPLMFSFVRFLITFFVLLLFYVVRKESALWKEDCASWNLSKKIGVAVYVGIVFMLGWFFISQNDSIDYKRDFTPYQELAMAFSEGQVYLLEEPSEELRNMVNPYDYRERKNSGIEIKWDFAYYEGKYYVYFGVLPCLLFYYPFYEATGMQLPDEIPTLLCVSLFALGVFFLFRQIILRFFPKTPYIFLWLAAAVTGMGCQMAVFLTQPEAYNIPIILAICLTVWGLYGWFVFLNTEKQGKGMRYVALFLGSFCMALVFGCRPQIGLYSLLAFPIMWPIIKDKNIRTKQKVLYVVTALSAYVLVAIPLMYYNFIRFGSVFDFGAMYNITVFDMTNVSVSFEKFICGAFEYLFRLPAIDLFYPLIDWSEAPHRYAGHFYFYSEPVLGGLFACNLILYCLFLGFYVKKDLKEKGICGLCLAMPMLGCIVLGIDAEIVGIVYRYIADFSIVMFIPCFMILFTIWEKVKGSIGAVYYKHAFLVLCVLSLAFNLLLFTADGIKFPLKEGNTVLYHQLKNAIMFW